MTNTPDNNDRHERALEKAHTAYWDYSSDPEGERDMAKAIAAYLSEMDAVIMPRELSHDLLEKAFPMPPRATDRPSAVRCHQVAQKFRAEEYATIVGAAPHHFNQEGK
jgi:hypothetical protein